MFSFKNCCFVLLTNYCFFAPELLLNSNIDVVNQLKSD